MKDLTHQIFNEEYTPEFIEELKAACLLKYPFLKDKLGVLESTAIFEERLSRYYSQPSEIISAHLQAQHDDNAAEGWNTD